MSTQGFLKDEKKLIQGVKYLPSVSIILPFEPVMFSGSERKRNLECAIRKAESELMRDYLTDKAMPVILKLRNVAHNVNFDTQKKTVAIFVSPVIEKIFYLDMPVEEKIIIDESFEIRDLVYNKKEVRDYILLVLGSQSQTIYLSTPTQFTRIASQVPDNLAAYENDIAEKVSNFSDPSYRKEVMLDKFLRHVDEGLDILLKAYRLPVFVMGAERTIGHFKKMSKNNQYVNAFIHGNFEDASEAKFRETMQPFIDDWNQVKQQALLQQLNAAVSRKELSIGVKDVWKAAFQKKGRLLIVEKNYMVPAKQGAEPEIIYQQDFSDNNSFYIKDAVDDIIEEVLQNGGDVEFVDPQVLTEYEHIALIRYY